MLEIFFFTAFGLIFYAYFGYPASLYLIGLFYKKVVIKEEFFPFVTLIITAYNEEKKIRQKLENTLSLEYPTEKLQIIVASDGSTDKTNEIVKIYEKQGISLLALLKRGGKENAQKEAVEKAKGDILVFTDVATILDSRGLQQIVFNFADPSVGSVSSEDRLIDKDGRSTGEGFYVKYEMWLRRLESKVNSIVGLSGSFFAARSDVCKDFSADMQSDFRTLLNSLNIGLRGISDPCSIGYYQDVSDEKKEFERKVRTVVRGLTVFFRHLQFLNFMRYGFFSYQFFCHKLLRWLVPFLLIIVLFLNIVLVTHSFLFLILLFCQIVFYVLAVWGYKKNKPDTNILIRLPIFFILVNVAIFFAWWRYLKGQRIVMWAPSKR